ncbi:MAG TPA: hypothetical protein VKU00_17760 [Chthonomonadaceae bacterium]|nr:hypothetical protein [Chthonomonadaceae bacterium]
MKNRRAPLLILLALLILVGLVVTGWLVGLFTKEHPLLEYATRIALPNSEAVYPYFWLSDQELLLYGDSPLVQTSSMFHWDTISKTRRDLPSFTDNINNNGYGPAYMEISPNSEWALWSKAENAGGGVYYSRLDGTGYEDYAESRPNTSLWMDNHRWVYFEHNSKYPNWDIVQAKIHNVTTKSLQKLPISADSPLQRGYEISMCVNSDAHVFTWIQDDSAKTADKFDIVEADLNAQGMPVRRFSIPLPMGSRVDELVFSPHFDRIAYLLTQQQVAPWEALVHRFYPAFAVHTHWYMRLFVSRLNGTGGHTLGSVETDPDMSVFPPVHELKWLPNGNQVSFVCRDELYTLPIH